MSFIKTIKIIVIFSRIAIFLTIYEVLYIVIMYVCSTSHRAYSINKLRLFCLSNVK